VSNDVSCKIRQTGYLHVHYFIPMCGAASSSRICKIIEVPIDLVVKSLTANQKVSSSNSH